VVTLELTFLLLVVGLAVGIPLALGQVYGGRGLVLLSSIYEQIFRSIPALVLLFLFFFGSSFIGLNISAFLSAVLALGFRSSAYQSQIFRGAIQSIPQGQMTAARSLGMGKFQAIRHIILPQALRLSLPPWSNELIYTLKYSSVAYMIGAPELMAQGKIIAAENFRYFEVFLVVAFIYLVAVLIVSRVLNMVEERVRIPGLQMAQ